MAGDRESALNLAEAHRRGLAITYEKCDVRAPDEVRQVVARIGRRLRLVVHNAGIAAPTRLRNKSIDVVLNVVGTKVEGFVNLVEALRGQNVELFCNVGSASGRIGGMVGQIDYAASNEALTRLGFWACTEHRLPDHAGLDHMGSDWPDRELRRGFALRHRAAGGQGHRKMDRRGARRKAR